MRRFSFTLVELLVVIAAISLLMAVLSPSLQRCRQQAKAVFCSSNVKQLMYALLMYETENQTFPYGFNVECCNPNGDAIEPLGGYPGNRVYDKEGWWWLNYISNYSSADTDKKKVFWCPSRRIKKSEFNYGLYGNYGVNQSICKKYKSKKSNPPEFFGSPLCGSDISKPAQTLLIVDSGYCLIKWWHATNDPDVVLDSAKIEDTAYIPGLKINEKRDLWPSHQQDAIYGRHPNKTVNVGFVDGHVSKKKADDLFVEKMEDGSYKNKSPLWVPE